MTTIVIHENNDESMCDFCEEIMEDSPYACSQNGEARICKTCAGILFIVLSSNKPGDGINITDLRKKP